MKILNKLTVRYLRLNKKRTIVTIIGILLSTALMVGMGLICSTIREYMLEQIIDDSGSFHARIQNVDYNKMYIVRNDKNIKNYYTEEIIGYSRYKESTNEYKPYIAILGVNKEYFKDLRLIKGNFPTNDTEIVIPEHIYKYGKFNYKVGDTITLDLGKRYLDNENIDFTPSYQEEEQLIINTTKTYKIVGIIKRSNYSFEDYSAAGFYSYTLLSSFDNNINLYVTYKNPKDAQDLSYELYKSLGKDTTNYDVDMNYSLLSMYGTSGYSNFDAAVSQVLGIALAIISVACIIVIYNSFAISVMERKKQFGLFASIGTTKKQLRHTILFEVLLVGTIGIILGIISSYIGIGIVIIIINHLVKTTFKLVTYPLFVIIPVIFMIITILISALIPMKRASSASPIQVIKQNDDIKLNKRRIKTLKITNKIFGIEGVIALKNIKRNKKKYRITIISLFISIVTFIAFSTYLDIGTKTSQYYIDNTKYDIMIIYKENTNDAKIVEEMLKIDEIKDYAITRSSYLQYKIKDNMYTKNYKELLSKDENNSKYANYINLVALDDKTYNDYISSMHIPYGSIIIGNKMIELDYSDNGRKVKNYEVFLGKKIDLDICYLDKLSNVEQIDGKLTNELTNKVVDEYCTYKLNNIYITDKYPKLFSDNVIMFVNNDIYNNLVKETSYKEYLEDNLNHKTVIIQADKYTKLNKLGATLTSSSYHNMKEENDLQKNTIIVIKILFYGFISLVVLIGVTSVFNTITTSIMLRRKEFSILRSIGLSPHGFNKMINYESIIFGLKSLLYGIPVGILLSLLISNSMRNIVSFDNIYIPYKAILISIIGVFTIVLITMWYSANKIKKDNILEAIREENI